jgi:hypothetical protein
VSSSPGPGLVDRVRTICLAFPAVTERLSHGTPTFFVRDKKSFVYAWVAGHHDHEFPHLWCAAPDGAQQELISDAPERFFRPPYVGHRGWLGVWLDVEQDWDEIAALVDGAYRCVAPARLAAMLDDRSSRAGWPTVPDR